MSQVTYYDFLGVSPDATGKEIRRAYRRLAMKYHPDKSGGDDEKFKHLQRVNEVLSNDHFRKIYDASGEQGLLEAVSKKATANKVRVVKHVMLCDLEELYMGTTKTLLLSKALVCYACEGSGLLEPKLFPCETCNGEMKFIRTVHLGPFTQQLEQNCPVCEGSGTQMRGSRRCDVCSGKKVVEKQQTIALVVERGLEHGHKIVFREVGDQSPGSIPGDVIITVSQRKHPVFQREGDLLVVYKTISLKEALCGFAFELTQLDGRVLRVASTPKDNVIKPGDVRVIRDEGMPVYKSASERGDLFIKFKVEFPKERIRDERFLELLSSMLPDGTHSEEMAWEPRRKRKRQEKHDPTAVELYEVDHVRQRRKQNERMLRTASHRNAESEVSPDPDYNSEAGTSCANQ